MHKKINFTYFRNTFNISIELFRCDTWKKIFFRRKKRSAPQFYAMSSRVLVRFSRIIFSSTNSPSTKFEKNQDFIFIMPRRPTPNLRLRTWKVTLKHTSIEFCILILCKKIEFAGPYYYVTFKLITAAVSTLEHRCPMGVVATEQTKRQRRFNFKMHA